MIACIQHKFCVLRIGVFIHFRYSISNVSSNTYKNISNHTYMYTHKHVHTHIHTHTHTHMHTHTRCRSKVSSNSHKNTHTTRTCSLKKSASVDTRKMIRVSGF